MVCRSESIEVQYIISQNNENLQIKNLFEQSNYVMSLFFLVQYIISLFMFNIRSFLNKNNGPF